MPSQDRTVKTKKHTDAHRSRDKADTHTQRDGKDEEFQSEEVRGVKE